MTLQRILLASALLAATLGMSAQTLAREAGEAPRHEDRQADRQADRRADRREDRREDHLDSRGSGKHGHDDAAGDDHGGGRHDADDPAGGHR